MQTILAFVAALGLLIVVHELGHYLVARACGVKVLKFSVGFGKPLISRRFGRDQTVWAIGMLPLGGFVSMLDERESDTPIDPAELPRAFNRQSPLKRIAIVSAGPIANLLLAVTLYAALDLHGVQEPRAVIGAPKADSIAAEAGVRAGDLLVAIDGLRVGPATLDKQLARCQPGQTVQVHAFRRDELMSFSVFLGEPSADTARLALTGGANALRRGWLGA